MAITVKPLKPVICRHASHADWGLGMIVEENASKFYAEFEDGGRRGFLNLQRYRDLMVPVEVEPKAASALIAKISKNASKPPPPVPGKKVKKKTAAAALPKEDVVEEAVEEESDQADDDE